jgi:predicted DNA-binding protein
MSSEYSVVPFRMSPEEKTMLKHMCRDADLSMAQWIRKAIKKAYKEMEKIP